MLCLLSHFNFVVFSSNFWSNNLVAFLWYFLWLVNVVCPNLFSAVVINSFLKYYFVFFSFFCSSYSISPFYLFSFGWNSISQCIVLVFLAFVKFKLFNCSTHFLYFTHIFCFNQMLFNINFFLFCFSFFFSLLSHVALTDQFMQI